MKIVTTYGGEPFQIAGWKHGAPYEPIVIGWTRSPQDVAVMKTLREEGDFHSVQMRSVKNRKTGDA